MNEQNINQLKLSEKFREQLGVELDWNTRGVTRGRGWSKSDGSYGWWVSEYNGTEFGGITYMFCGPITSYISKKIILDLLEESQSEYGVFRAWKDKNGNLIKE